MCRINGPPLLIKINKQTTNEQPNSVLPWLRHLCHKDLDRQRQRNMSM